MSHNLYHCLKYTNVFDSTMIYMTKQKNLKPGRSKKSSKKLPDHGMSFLQSQWDPLLLQNAKHPPTQLHSEFFADWTCNLWTSQHHCISVCSATTTIVLFLGNLYATSGLKAADSNVVKPITDRQVHFCVCFICWSTCCIRQSKMNCKLRKYF